MAQQSVKTPKKRLFLFNTLKRPMPYIGLIIAALIVVFQSSLRRYASSVVGGWLVENVRESTEGNYLMNYDYVRFDIFTKELRIKNLDVKLDTSMVSEEEYLANHTNLMDLSTPLVVLKLRSLWDLAFNDKLHIAYIGLQEPDVKLKRSENLSESQNVANEQIATERLRNYLEELKIDSFRIVNGAIEVDLEDAKSENILDFKIRNFTTLIKGFRLDKIDPDKIFQGIYAEKFELEVLDQEISLPKLHHKLEFKRLWVSTLDSVIQLDMAHIMPLAGSTYKLKTNLKLNKLALTGIDFREAYEHEILDVRNITIDKPEVSLINIINALTQAENDPDSIFYMFFDKTNIHNLSLNQGEVDIDFGRTYSFSNLNISIKDYRIDSLYTTLNNLKSSLEHFNLSVSNMSLDMPDSIHMVEIGNVHLSSNDELAVVNNVRLRPKPDRMHYQLYKERGVKLINYATIKHLVLYGINYPEAINNGQLLADSLLISAPKLKTTEYPYIITKGLTKLASPYLIKKVEVSNGSIDYNKRHSGEDHRTHLAGIDASINNLYNGDGLTPYFDNIDLKAVEGSNELKGIGHTLSFTGLQTKNLRDFDLANLTLRPDSASINGEKIILNAANIHLRGFDLDLFTKVREIDIKLLTTERLSINADLRAKVKRIGVSDYNVLKSIKVDKLYIKQSDIDLINEDQEFSFADILVNMDSLDFDSDRPDEQSPFAFHNLNLSHGKFTYRNKPDKLLVTGRLGEFIEATSTLVFQNLEFSSGKNISGSLNKFILKGLDRFALANKEGISFDYVILDKPKFNITQDSAVVTGKKIQPKLLRKAILDQFAYVKFDSIITNEANIILTSHARKTTLTNISSHIGSYFLDSTYVAEQLFHPSNFTFTIDNIISTSAKDTINISQVNADLVQNRLFTGKIDLIVYLQKNHLKVDAPGINLGGFKTVDMLNGNYSIDSLRMANAKISLITPVVNNKPKAKAEKVDKSIDDAITQLFKKSGNLMFDSLLRTTMAPKPATPKDSTANKSVGLKKLFDKLRTEQVKDVAEHPQEEPVDSVITVKIDKKALPSNGIIRNIFVSNSTFSLLKNDDPRSYFSNLQFNLNVTNLILDSINSFNIFNHMYNLKLDVYDYTANLPDSLNTLSFKQFTLNTRDESMNVHGLNLTPRVGKYDYANAVGYQVSWQQLTGLDIKIERLNLFDFFDKRAIVAHKITTYDGTLDVFRDKELAIPVNQRRPMPQDALKNLDLAVLIDSVVVKNLDVNFASRLSSTQPDGELDFKAINATVTNIVNTDSAISINSNLRLKASGKIMNQGLLSTNFAFDLADPDNRFIFDAHLNAMNAQAFNSLLEATAYVSVESGNIKDLKLEAEGDNLYATGTMQFAYSDLKVSTINKKNLKTSGMGLVIKSFFANAFVVRKNNPSVKFFPREGAMYFERDPQKIIIDYAAKTALSGIVSSIGARNARKDIKKIQRESKNEQDNQRKEQKKAEKSASD